MEIHENSQNTQANNRARTMTITSGKGGVGKSCIAVNLAIALAKRGAKVCLFDADTGLANINILLNLKPEYTIEHVLRGEKELTRIMLNGPYDIRIIPGASGISEYAHLQPEHQRQLIHALVAIEKHFDYILIDTPAGIGNNVLNFTRSAQQAIAVISPEPTSLTDTFSLIKVLKRQGYQQAVQVLVNMCQDAEQGRQVFSRLAGASKKYLDLQLSHLASIPYNKTMHLAVKQQRPVALYPDSDPFSHCFSKLAGSVDQHWQNLDFSYSFGSYWQQLGEEQDLSTQRSKKASKEGSKEAPKEISNSSPTIEISTLPETASTDSALVDDKVNDILSLLDHKRWDEQHLQSFIERMTDSYIKRYETAPNNTSKALDKSLPNSEPQSQPLWNKLADSLHQVEKTPLLSEEKTHNNSKIINQAQQKTPMKALNVAQAKESNHNNNGCIDNQDSLLNKLQSRDPGQSVDQFLRSLMN